MTVCVGSTNEWREVGKMGLRAQRLAYISLPPRHDYTIQTFFFIAQWPVFSVCFMNYVNGEGILFFTLWPNEEKIEVREMPPLHFFSSCPLLTLPVNLSCRQCGSGISAPRPCERMTVAAWAGGGGGSAHNDIHEELRRQAGKECWPCCWTAWHWLMRERKKDREKIRSEGWHWYSRPAWGSWTPVRGGERLRKSPRLHCWSGRGQHHHHHQSVQCVFTCASPVTHRLFSPRYCPSSSVHKNTCRCTQFNASHINPHPSKRSKRLPSSTSPSSSSSRIVLLSVKENGKALAVRALTPNLHQMQLWDVMNTRQFWAVMQMVSVPTVSMSHFPLIYVHP